MCIATFQRKKIMPKDKIEIDLEDEAVKKVIADAAALQFEAMYAEKHAAETEGLLNKNAELLSEKKGVKEKYDTILAQHNAITEKYNFEEIDTQLAAAEEARLAAMSDTERTEAKLASAKEDFLLEKANILKERDTKEQEYESMLEKKTRALNKSLVNSGLTEAISVEGGYDHLLKPILSNQVKVVLDGDDYVARVMESGEVRMNSEGSPMSIQELVQLHKEDEKYGVCFKDSGASGGSATGNGTQKPVVREGDLKRSEMDFAAKSKYIEKHGQDKYLALPE